MDNIGYTGRIFGFIKTVAICAIQGLDFTSQAIYSNQLKPNQGVKGFDLGLKG